MKVSAFVLALPAAQAFQVARPLTASVGPLFSSPEGYSVPLDYANGGIPNIAPDIAPMDLVHQEPADEIREVGIAPGNEQVRISGELLGMDTGYQPNTEVALATAAASPATKKIPKIKCYQTSKKIIRYDFQGPLPMMVTIDDLMKPKTFITSNPVSQPKTEVALATVAASSETATKKVPKIKCYQTSKKIVRYDFKGPFPMMITIDELMKPDTFITSNPKK